MLANEYRQTIVDCWPRNPVVCCSPSRAKALQMDVSHQSKSKDTPESLKKLLQRFSIRLSSHIIDFGGVHLSLYLIVLLHHCDERSHDRFSRRV